MKIGRKLTFPICRISLKTQHLTCPLINHCVTFHHDIFWSPFHASFLVVSFISFWSYTCWSMTCCLRSSSTHVIQTGVSEPKIISLYIVMVSLMASSSSFFVLIQFRRSIFNFFASSNSDVLFIYYQFCNPRQVTKNLLTFFFTHQKIHHHHRSTYCIAGFLHQCIYTIQHIPVDDNFYLVYIQNQFLALSLH